MSMFPKIFKDEKTLTEEDVFVRGEECKKCDEIRCFNCDHNYWVVGKEFESIIKEVGKCNSCILNGGECLSGPIGSCRGTILNKYYKMKAEDLL